MSLFIITGMSGAGKSRAVDALEDIGFYCIDNLPPHFLTPLANFAKESSTAHDLALVIDARSKEMFTAFADELDKLRASHIAYKLLFIDCDEQVLLNRYKETRRKHPLMDEDNSSLEEAIDREREILKPIKESADYFIDTTHLTTAQFKQDVIDMCQNAPLARLQLKLVSFGYKYGIPNDADVVLDVRCLPNPYYVAELKNKTGLDNKVFDYVFSFNQSIELRDKLYDLLRFTVPLYIEEGKSQLVVAIGCTGGKHRSVSFVRYLEKVLQFPDVNTLAVHRDVKINNK